MSGSADAAYQKKINGWGLEEGDVARLCKERIFRILYHPTTTKRLVFTGDKVCSTQTFMTAKAVELRPSDGLIQLQNV